MLNHLHKEARDPYLKTYLNILWTQKPAERPFDFTPSRAKEEGKVMEKLNWTDPVAKPSEIVSKPRDPKKRTRDDMTVASTEQVSGDDSTFGRLPSKKLRLEEPGIRKTPALITPL